MSIKEKTLCHNIRHKKYKRALDCELSDNENAPTVLSAGQKFARSTLDGLSEKRKVKIVNRYIDTRAGLPVPQPDGHLVERLNWQAYKPRNTRTETEKGRLKYSERGNSKLQYIRSPRFG